MAPKTNSSKRPTHYLYAVSKHGESTTWTRIGAAWPNGDGKGYSFRLSLIPIDGSDIVMREPKAEGVSDEAQMAAV